MSDCLPTHTQGDFLCERKEKICFFRKKLRIYSSNFETIIYRMVCLSVTGIFFSSCIFLIFAPWGRKSLFYSYNSDLISKKIGKDSSFKNADVASQTSFSFINTLNSMKNTPSPLHLLLRVYCCCYGSIVEGDKNMLDIIHVFFLFVIRDSLIWWEFFSF